MERSGGLVVNRALVQRWEEITNGSVPATRIYFALL